MAVKIGHASIDERGRASGGAAGDQTGREVCTRDWYSKPWIAVIRPKDAAAAEKIAKAMEAACANNNIGYDQSQRTTLFALAQKNGWNISAIKTKCETDCSALVAVCVNAAGIAVSKDIYTGNEQASLMKTGKFELHTDSSYVGHSDKLRRGDVLLGKGHTAIVLSNGPQAGKAAPAGSKTNAKPAGKGTFITTANLNLRKNAGKDSPVLTTIPEGSAVKCDGECKLVDGTKWYHAEFAGKSGFCSGKYLRSK